MGGTAAEHWTGPNFDSNSSYRTSARQQDFHTLAILTGWPPSEGKHNGRIDREVLASAGDTLPTGSQPASQWFWVMSPKNLTAQGTTPEVGSLVRKPNDVTLTDGSG